jgi:hypothetical protein
MKREPIRYSLIILGTLDLVSFYRTYETGLYVWNEILILLEYVFDSKADLWVNILSLGISILNLILILLFFVSGLLLIIGKRAGIIVYYFEFPLRLMFITLTFGFVLKLFGIVFGSLLYNLILMLLVGLEILRLIFSIWVRRKYFETMQTDTNNKYFRV